MTPDPGRVRAAGGVVWRRGPDGAPRWAVVHRPRYDDWSLPKGKAAPGEELEAAALREVAEETGMDCRLGSHLGSHRYVDQRGRPKTTDYWLMEAVGGDFRPGDEVDELRWLDAAEAGRVLSYERDRELVAAAAAGLGPGGGPVTPASGGS